MSDETHLTWEYNRRLVASLTYHRTDWLYSPWRRWLARKLFGIEVTFPARPEAPTP